jgi:hypothetical protein
MVADTVSTGIIMATMVIIVTIIIVVAGAVRTSLSMCRIEAIIIESDARQSRCATSTATAGWSVNAIERAIIKIISKIADELFATQSKIRYNVGYFFNQL